MLRDNSVRVGNEPEGRWDHHAEGLADRRRWWALAGTEWAPVSAQEGHPGCREVRGPKRPAERQSQRSWEPRGGSCETGCAGGLPTSGGGEGKADTTPARAHKKGSKDKTGVQGDTGNKAAGDKMTLKAFSVFDPFPLWASVSPLVSEP